MATVAVQVPRILQRHCGDRDSIEVNAANVSEALSAVKSGFPELYVNICDETDRVRQHINLFINNDLIDRDSLDQSNLKTGDDLLIFTSVSGG